ncbi:MAG: hypothetical protein K2H61_07005 [Muribaculaceae bacterium]|nr:hypothetical protein [Muribaculaceae bacterium]
MQANDKVENIIVLGGGESGAGAAVLAKVKGHRVLLSDSGNLAPRYKELLQQHDIEFEEGGHTCLLYKTTRPPDLTTSIMQSYA